MFKKMLIASAILLTTGQAAYANGAYVGADIGANYALFKDDFEYGDAKFGDLGAVLDLFLGYGKMVNQTIYLGGEVFASGYSSDVEGLSIEDNSAHYKTKYSYGASVIPGILLSQNTMAYARLGVVQTGFKLESDSPLGNSSKNETVTGGQAGLGLQTHLTKNLDLRGEYDFTAYKSFDSGDDTIKPSSGQAKVGLVYHID